MLWRTLVLGLTIQAFLFKIVLSEEATEHARIIASVLVAMFAAPGSLHLQARHRFVALQHAMDFHWNESASALYRA
jgi:hypothetical protein